MRVVFWSFLLHPLPSSVQYLRAPRVVVEINLDRDALRGRISDEPAKGVVGVHVRIEGRPDLTAWRANGRLKDVPRALTDSLRFLNPSSLQAFKALDAVASLGRQASKPKERPILSANLIPKDVVEPRHPQLFDLVR